VTTPIHISFSSEDDTLGVLWEQGYVELWSLEIRLGPGNTKIMDPLKVWFGWIAKHDESSITLFRHLVVMTIDAQTRSYSVTALGMNVASSIDYISVVTIESGLLKNNEFFSLPTKNARLLTPAVDGFYEMQNGDVVTCTQCSPIV
jgi:elongator complex protein 1